MKSKVLTLCLGGCFALTSFVARPALADEWDKKTDFQFSAPVEIPGRVLPAGRYVFRLAAGESESAVQIFSEDSKGNEELVATLLTVPDYIDETPDKPVVHFEERHSGTPEAIQSWYYLGEKTGWAFIYPDDQFEKAD